MDTSSPAVTGTQVRRGRLRTSQRAETSRDAAHSGWSGAYFSWGLQQDLDGQPVKARCAATIPGRTPPAIATPSSVLVILEACLDRILHNKSTTLLA